MSSTPIPTRADLVDAALRWEGVPWRHQGRTRAGIDCAGLPILVGLEFGLLKSDVRNYPKRPNGTFLSHFDANLFRIPLVEHKRGDILVFAGTDHVHVCHCGIAALKYGVQSIVHAHATRRRVIHERLDEARTVVGRPVYAYRYHGID